MKFNKILAGILAVGCVLTSSAVLPVTAIPTATMAALAEEETTIFYHWNAEDTLFTLSEDGKTATIYGEGILPSTSVSDAKYKNDVAKLEYVTNVQFAEDSHFTAFASSSFSKLKQMENITIPDSVEEISMNAFPNSMKLNYDADGLAWADNWIINFQVPKTW